jgi:hypothetical protein
MAETVKTPHRYHRYHHNNHYFGPQKKRPLGESAKFAQWATAGKTLTPYEFQLDSIIIGAVNMGVLPDDDTPATFEELNVPPDGSPQDYTMRYAPESPNPSPYIVTINTDKAKADLSVYDLLMAISDDPNNPLGLYIAPYVGPQDEGDWKFVVADDDVDHLYLENLTLHPVPGQPLPGGEYTYPTTGDYDDPVNPTKWEGWAWTDIYGRYIGEPGENNPNGAPASMSGLPGETMDDQLLFDGDDQAFSKLVLNYTETDYTWTPQSKSK